MCHFDKSLVMRSNGSKWHLFLQLIRQPYFKQFSGTRNRSYDSYGKHAKHSWRFWLSDCLFLWRCLNLKRLWEDHGQYHLVGKFWDIHTRHPRTTVYFSARQHDLTIRSIRQQTYVSNRVNASNKLHICSVYSNNVIKMCEILLHC